ncbi:dihydrofolate reductase [Methyloradius palustris]|uniref:Dihydrofolate reductase n=2 Tax=Methyloradius palustris TaxID=2778876 RepID=A0A8D5G927_9PROT|nr:dihydrofolate reductase [Methyloradius palustris]
MGGTYNYAMTQLSLIVAIAQNRVIGANNALPWHLPEDLKRFRALTTGHHIIMGRKTYDSLNRLLPNRTTVIVTRNPHYKVPGALIAHSLADAIKQAVNDDEVFLIGGAELYRDGLNLADKLYLTEIEASFEGDAFFPEINLMEWAEIGREKHISEKGLTFSYITYQRKR